MRALIVPPADAGSFGDLAMLTALVHQLASHGIHSRLLSAPNAWPALAPSVNISQLSHFDIAYIIGADVIDGSFGYSNQEHLLYSVASFFRKRAVVCSFSFRSDPHPQSLISLRRLLHRGVRFAARDPFSWLRFEQHIGPATLSADLSFLLPPISRSLPLFLRHASPRPVVGISINALHPPSNLEAFASQLLSYSDWFYLLIPHDFRSRCDDLAIATRLGGLLPNRSYVWHPPHPSAVKSACRYCNLVITSRMHVAAIALSVGTPAIALDYNDKARGLLAAFGADFLAFPISEFYTRALDTASCVLSPRCAALRSQIRASLPTLRRRARLNLFL